MSAEPNLEGIVKVAVTPEPKSRGNGQATGDLNQNGVEGPESNCDRAAAEALAALRRAALPALQHPRPLELFAESCREMGLGGNLSLATTAYLAATTRVLPKRTGLHGHLFVLGPPSSGKSHEADAALAHLPDSALARYDGASPRALIYSKKPIKHRVLAYAEMDSLPATGDDDASNVALSFLRTLVVNGTATYHVTVKSKDGFTTKAYTKEGPATLLITGTRKIPDEQLCSRLHEVEVTVDRARLQSVVAAQGALMSGRHHSVAASPEIVAMQTYLQALAPIPVVIPFAEKLGTAILTTAKITDPRLTREFPRVAGFTAAHAVLSMERRERQDGAIVATLEDYAVARDVVRELTTTREFGSFAVEVWGAIADLHRETGEAVGVGAVSKKLLKARQHVSRQFTSLLAGGALLDARERPGRTSPYLVTPVGESPGRVLLPAVEDLGSFSPPGKQFKRSHLETGQAVSLNVQGRCLNIQASSLTGNDLTRLEPETPGGEEGSDEVAPDTDPAACPRCFSDSCPGDCCWIAGKVYRVGDHLADGRWIESVDNGIPSVVRPREVRP